MESSRFRVLGPAVLVREESSSKSVHSYPIDTSITMRNRVSFYPFVATTPRKGQSPLHTELVAKSGPKMEHYKAITSNRSCTVQGRNYYIHVSKDIFARLLGIFSIAHEVIAWETIVMAAQTLSNNFNKRKVKSLKPCTYCDKGRYTSWMLIGLFMANHHIAKDVSISTGNMDQTSAFPFHWTRSRSADYFQCLIAFFNITSSG
ncbi:hypothetical protein HAX54_048070 [Datura stramonium]|uniref:Uncharacterized protein n=1 Tax=Datura stramonium TaxID=4076 RepID=A0ABS8RQU9_DATST|nr:hypothetical protein [Datura stramonium]